MQLIDVEITDPQFGYSIGITGNGERAFIKNGHLSKQKKIKVVFIRKSQHGIEAELIETYDNKVVLDKHLDNDYLVHTKNIDKIIDNNIFEIESKWFFPDNRIKKTIEYLLKNDHLWGNSKISLKSNLSTSHAAKWFGLSFKFAINKLKDTGYPEKAKFYCPTKHDFAQEGAVAEMLTKIHTNKERKIVIGIWQGIGNAQEVFYAHGILDKSTNMFNHFDCALINCDITECERLFTENKKIKGESQKKLFRIDGNVDIHHIYELAIRFFPLDELIDEYFEMEEI